MSKIEMPHYLRPVGDIECMTATGRMLLYRGLIDGHNDHDESIENVVLAGLQVIKRIETLEKQFTWCHICLEPIIHGNCLCGENTYTPDDILPEHASRIDDTGDERPCPYCHVMGWHDCKEEPKADIPCPDCNGSGKEICDNPDHGGIEASLYGAENNRLGCPGCGHDPDHYTGLKCETCGGTGVIPKEKAKPSHPSCPHCGVEIAEPLVIKLSEAGYFVQCPACGATGPIASDTYGAAAAWKCTADIEPKAEPEYPMCSECGCDLEAGKCPACEMRDNFPEPEEPAEPEATEHLILPEIDKDYHWEIFNGKVCAIESNPPLGQGELQGTTFAQLPDSEELIKLRAEIKGSAKAYQTLCEEMMPVIENEKKLIAENAELTEDRDLWKKSEHECTEANKKLEADNAERRSDYNSLGHLLDTTQADNAELKAQIGRHEKVKQQMRLLHLNIGVDIKRGKAYWELRTAQRELQKYFDALTPPQGVTR